MDWRSGVTGGNPDRSTAVDGFVDGEGRRDEKSLASLAIAALRQGGESSSGEFTAEVNPLFRSGDAAAGGKGSDDRVGSGSFSTNFSGASTQVPEFSSTGTGGTNTTKGRDRSGGSTSREWIWDKSPETVRTVCGDSRLKRYCFLSFFSPRIFRSFFFWYKCLCGVCMRTLVGFISMSKVQPRYVVAGLKTGSRLLGVCSCALSPLTILWVVVFL